MIDLIMICSIVTYSYSSYTIWKLTDINATEFWVVYLVTWITFDTDWISTKDWYYYWPDCKFVQ